MRLLKYQSIIKFTDITASSNMIELIILAPSPILAWAAIETLGPILAPLWIWAVGWTQTRPSTYSGFKDLGLVNIVESI